MARVLVVDDEPSIREILAEFLAGEGHAVCTAESVSEATALLEREELDVVVTDIILPQASGIELLRLLSSRAPSVKVVLITGEPNVATATEAVRLGAFDYLPKPVTQSAISRVVDSAARVKAVEDENTRYRERLEQIVRERTRRIQEYTERLRQVADRTQGFAMCADVADLAPSVLALFADAMAAQGGSFYHVAGDGLDLVASLDEGHQRRRIALPLEDGTILASALERREGRAIRDLGDHPELKRSGWHGYRDGSLLVLPCVDAGGEVYGIVTLHNKSQPPFTEEDLEIGRIVAGHAVEAIRAMELNRRLRASEQKYRELAEHSLMGIFVADEGRVVYANPRALEIAGLDSAAAESVTGRPLLDFVWPEDREWLGREIEGYLRGERRPRRYELRLAGRDGTPVWVEALLTGVEHEGKRRLLGNLLDVTSRRRAEEEKSALQAQFLQAQKMEVIGRLAGGVAHDFNNLLTAFVGYSELALEALASDHKARAHVLEIRQAADRATALTRQLLAFARKQVSEPRIVDLNALISGSKLMAERIIGEDVDLVFEPGPGLWRVQADPVQVDQIVLNLATNARDAMPRGGRLTLTTANVAASDGRARGDAVCLSIRDTGAGMAEDVRARACEPFFTTKDRGTGLGLSTVRDIADRHGARVEIDSAPGRGTCVSIYFPRRDEAAVRGGEAGPEPAAQPKGTETVLLVEDDAAVRRFTREALEAQGYTVLEAANGADAFGVAATEPGEIQLLVCDVVLPGVNGWLVYKALRQRRPALRRLFISGYARDVLTRHGVVEPAQRLLPKPFSIQTLAQKVREALDA
jgi:PAS domain S-box-containing protein